MNAVVVRFDPAFSRPGTWFIRDDGRVCARFKLGDVEHVVDFHPRWRMLAPGRVFVSPLTGDLDTWVTESSTFGGQLDVAVSLQLSECPKHTAETMSGW